MTYIQVSFNSKILGNSSWKQNTQKYNNQFIKVYNKKTKFQIQNKSSVATDPTAFLQPFYQGMKSMKPHLSAACSPIMPRENMRARE